MVVTTRPCNATKHPGLRARGDPDELAEAAARKEERTAKQAERERNSEEKKTRTQRVARFEDHLLEEMNEEKRRATEIKRPQIKQKSSGRQPKATKQASAEDTVEPTEEEDLAEANSQAEPDEVSVDGISETELGKKKTSKKKTSARDEIEGLRTRRRVVTVVEGSESDSDEMETPRARKPRGKNKGTANQGIDESQSNIPSPSYNSNFGDDVSSAQWGTSDGRKSASSNHSTSAMPDTATAPKATSTARGGRRGRGRGRGTGGMGRGGKSGRGELSDTEVTQEATVDKGKDIPTADDEDANQGTSGGMMAGAKRGRVRGRGGRASGRGRGGGCGGGRGCGGKVAPAATTNNNNDDSEDEQEQEAVEVQPVEDEPRPVLLGGRPRGGRRSLNPAKHPASRDLADTEQATSVMSSSSGGSRAKGSKRGSDTALNDPWQVSKRPRPSTELDVFGGNIDNASTSSGLKKCSSPGDDSDLDDDHSDKRKRLRANKDTQYTMAIERSATNHAVITADSPSTVRSRLNRRQLLFGLDSPRIAGSRRPIPIIIPDTLAPPPRKGKSTVPADLMPSPTPHRINKVRDDDPSGLFESDEEVERQAAMASPLKAVEHRKTTMNMVGVKADPRPATEEANVNAKTKKGKAVERADAAPQSSEDASEKDKRPKAQLEDLPLKIQEDWPTFGATYNMWAASCCNPFDITPEDSCSAIETIYYHMFGNRHAGDGIGPPFAAKSCVVEYCRQHFNQYKNHMASTAVIALNAFFDHASNAGKYDTMEKRKCYAREQLEDDRFIYKAFTHIDGEPAAAGVFCSSLVLSCFGVHFDKVEGAEEDIITFSVDDDNLAPVGGLALAAAAVERALEAYASGRVAFAEDKQGNSKRSKKKKTSNVKPTVFCLGNDPQSSSQDLYFSRDNYGNDVDDYAAAIAEMDDNQWEEVLQLGMSYGSKYRRNNQGTSESTGPATLPDSQPKRARKKIIVIPNLKV